MQEARGRRQEARGRRQEAGSRRQEARGTPYPMFYPNNESGQAVVMALLALAIAVLIISVFLYFASTSQLATRAAGEQTIERYSADAGAEHAIWRLQYEPGFPLTVTNHSPYSYTITINHRTVFITVERVP